MELIKVSDRIWYSAFEEERDRPGLGYIRGDHWSIAVTVRLFTNISPHTDDTTLVYIPEEKFLFVGDCISGVFPTWERDSRKTKELITTIKKTDAECCLGGHWPLFRKQEILDALEEDSDEV